MRLPQAGFKRQIRSTSVASPQAATRDPGPAAKVGRRTLALPLPPVMVAAISNRAPRALEAANMKNGGQ
jgi:hypothetical protein